MQLQNELDIPTLPIMQNVVHEGICGMSPSRCSAPKPHTKCGGDTKCDMEVPVYLLSFGHHCCDTSCVTNTNLRCCGTHRQRREKLLAILLLDLCNTCSALD